MGFHLSKQNSELGLFSCFTKAIGDLKDFIDMSWTKLEVDFLPPIGPD